MDDYDFVYDETYPSKEYFEPLHQKFSGKCRVLHTTFKDETDYFHVNLDIGECDCEGGAAWYWHTKKSQWRLNKYCSHKIKAISDILERSQEDLTYFYKKALVTNYNPWDVTSAFHKELRRGDIEKAWYWANILITMMGIRRPLQYMLHIVFEETRDMALAKWLFNRFLNSEDLTVAEVCKGVMWFCKATKKWELPHRYKIFNSEMNGYKMLIDTYGKQIASPKGVVPFPDIPVLENVLLDGIKTKDFTKIQYGVKGLQKVETEDKIIKTKIRIDILDFVDSHTKGNKQFREWLNFKANAYELRYHDVNAYVDMVLHGESEKGYSLSPIEVKSIMNLPKSKRPKLIMGKIVRVPLYAYDNHTWKGKGLIRSHAEQLTQFATQTNIDMRWCGAYFGVAWRMYAYKQHGTLDIKWNEVRWPVHIYNITQKLWY